LIFCVRLSVAKCKIVKNSTSRLGLVV
jgi:hypothetical protein